MFADSPTLSPTQVQTWPVLQEAVTVIKAMPWFDLFKMTMHVIA